MRPETIIRLVGIGSVIVALSAYGAWMYSMGKKYHDLQEAKSAAEALKSRVIINDTVRGHDSRIELRQWERE